MSAEMLDAKNLNAENLVSKIGQQARACAAQLSTASTDAKNKALIAIADAIDAQSDKLLAANAADLARAKESGISDALFDRLELNPARIASMSKGLRDIAGQFDPVGAMSASERQPSGLEIAKMRVPLGVIGVIYESRPNVTADAAALCIKSGNAVVLRGGSEAIESNMAIAACIKQGLHAANLPEHAVQLIETTDRAAVSALLKAEDYIDVIIPRGGKGLIERISADAKVPVIKHLDGICHVYIDEGADADKAIAVAVNAKTYRYGICGSMETLLIAESEAQELLPQFEAAFKEYNVELRGCDKARAIVSGMNEATEEDWHTEYLGPVLSIKVVDSIDDAISHIAKYGSGHTDAIITNDIQRAAKFTRHVDSSSVMVNAATCFADGAQYGLGAEIGISTNKMHVRGPVGLLGLTTEKYVVTGNGTIRQ
jgi:glutamate-5-semialdehyde dehydrogenase